MTPHNFRVGTYSTSFAYRDKQIVVNFYAKQGTDAIVDTVLFLGTGQVGKIPRWVAANVPAGVVVVEGLPHWESEPDGSDLVAFSHLYTQVAFDAVRATFGCSTMHIIGSSQAAPSAVWVANNNSKQVRNVALVLPMGLNAAYFGPGGKVKFGELRRRALLTMLQKDQSIFSDVRNAYISLCLMRIILSGIRDGSTVKKYTVGISEDTTGAVRQLVAVQKQRRRKLVVYAGTQDKVFPPQEIRQTLRDAGVDDVDVVVVSGISHASLATRKYSPFLTRIVSDIRG